MTLDDFTTILYPILGEWDRYPWIVCNDGFTISCQGGKGLRSTPKTHSWTYTDMELRSLNRTEELLRDYAEAPSGDLTQSVYPLIPSSLVQKVIDKHRGIDIETTFYRDDFKAAARKYFLRKKIETILK